MLQIVRILGFLVNIYMLIITVRIILTWFAGLGQSRLQDYLAMITDPYLNWFRRFTFLRVGFLDLSPIAALGVLSLVHNILRTLAFYGRITIGIILAMILQGVWAAVSFIIGFLVIILILRLVAHLTKQNMYGPFWRIINAVSQPVLYRINRILFKDRIVNYVTGLVLSIAALGIIYFALKFLVSFISVFLARLPV